MPTNPLCLKFWRGKTLCYIIHVQHFMYNLHEDRDLQAERDLYAVTQLPTCTGKRGWEGCWRVRHAMCVCVSSWQLYKCLLQFDTIWYVYRGSRRSQNLVAISERHCQPLLTSKASCMGNNGKNWLLNPGTSSQSEGYSSKWLIWLVCGEPLV